MDAERWVLQIRLDVSSTVLYYPGGSTQKSPGTFQMVVYASSCLHIGIYLSI